MHDDVSSYCLKLAANLLLGKAAPDWAVKRHLSRIVVECIHQPRNLHGLLEIIPVPHLCIAVEHEVVEIHEERVVPSLCSLRD